MGDGGCIEDVLSDESSSGLLLNERFCTGTECIYIFAIKCILIEKYRSDMHSGGAVSYSCG